MGRPSTINVIFLLQLTRLHLPTLLLAQYTSTEAALESAGPNAEIVYSALHCRSSGMKD